MPDELCMMSIKLMRVLMRILQLFFVVYDNQMYRRMAIGDDMK